MPPPSLRGRMLALPLAAALFLPALQARSPEKQPAKAPAVPAGAALGADTSGNASIWAFIVGILEWQDKDSYGSFPKKDRRDARLARYFKGKGVPEDHIVFLTDSQATKETLEKRFASFLSRSREGDTLFFYYAGHGSREKPGTTYFVPYDGRGGDAAASSWSVPAIFDAIETGFKGATAILTADCCYSGALAVEAKKRAGRVSYGCLASSQSSSPSTGRWTFTESLLAGLHGRAVVDQDRDRKIVFQELAEYIESEMAFAEKQLSSHAVTGSFGPATKLADVSSKAGPWDGSQVMVQWRDDEWYPARIQGRRGDGFKIKYVEDSTTEAVAPARVKAYEASPRRPDGQRVEVEWNGLWYPAAIRDYKKGLHLVHYDGFEEYWDEWASPDRIREP